MSVIHLQGDAEKAQGVYYEVDTSSQPLGFGGMGAVFSGIRVEPSGLKRKVAVKFLYDDLPEKAIQRSKQEASIQIHNDNLIEMFGFIETDELLPNGASVKRYHVVSELLTGVTLFELLQGKTTAKDGTPIPFAIKLYQDLQKDREQFAKSIIRSLLSGVMALHDKGFIHRDIDPSNIMITGDGKIKLIDLGIAKYLDDVVYTGPQLTSMGQMLGKTSYAAPEQIDGDVIHENFSTDLYAVGILFFELVTGHKPFTGSNSEVANMHRNEPMPLEEISNGDIRKVIDKATRKIRSERFQSAAEFRVAIDNIGKSTMKTKNSIVKSDEKHTPVKEAKLSNIQNTSRLHSTSRWLSWTIIIVVGLVLGIILELILKS